MGHPGSWQGKKWECSLQPSKNIYGEDTERAHAVDTRTRSLLFSPWIFICRASATTKRVRTKNSIRHQ